MRYIYKLQWLLCFVLLHVALSAMADTAGKTGNISGKVTTSDGQVASFVTIALPEINRGTVTGEDGRFTLSGIKPGTYTLRCSSVGLEPRETTVTVELDKTTRIDFTLNESAAQLSEVVVTGARSINRKPVEMGKIAINPIDMPQSMAVIGSEVIANQQASKLSDVIKNVNGVSLGTTRGSTSETFFARGYNLGANNILKNGARSNSAVIPEASTLERVEVLKGSAALLYGNVSSGAVINMVTKQPKFNYGGEVSMRVGSYNLYKPVADVYGPITKNLAFRVVGTYENAESYRTSVQSERFYVNPSLLYKLGAKTEILVQGDYMTHDFTPDFGIGTLGGKTISKDISRSAFFNTPWAFNEVEQTTTTATINHTFNDAWKLNVVGSYQAFDRNYFSTERIQADEVGDWKRKLTRSKIGEDYYTGQVNLNGDFKTGSIRHQLLVGVDAEQYMNISHTFNIDLMGLENKKSGIYDTINILNPSKYIAHTYEPVTDMKTRTEAPTQRIGFYAQNLFSLSEKFKVLGGIRWSVQRVGVSDVYNFETDTKAPAANTKTKYDRAFSPRVGLVYQPVSFISLFTSYSNNFTPNSGTDIYDQALEPSIIDQYEAGIKTDLLQDKLSANVTVYRIKNSNLAQMAQFKANGTVNSESNIKELTGETTSDGVELDLNGTLDNGLTFLAGYSYNDMRYTKTSGLTGSYLEGERLVSSPAHTANGSVFYTLQSTALKGLKFGVSGFYTGERNAGWNTTHVVATKPDGTKERSLNNRLFAVYGFTTFDVSMGYTYKKLSLLGKLSNITNELNYYVHENYSVNPIPPRQFVTTVSYKF
ncbi:TonB-dependent receptor [Pontibacter pudoricolor]|uniref:TonB-dependent receptor n=1 Tax=Pontibacter pudoricolor TaxID=2694930 RepID=UPI001391CA47|nr:TonB-dependent receptor [Pontibacter pudoricolor]